MDIALAALIGILVGITLDELFAGKVIKAVRSELSLLHSKIDGLLFYLEGKSAAPVIKANDLPHVIVDPIVGDPNQPKQ